MGKLDGRVAVVTGAARGMGAAEARLFAAEGARVVVADLLDEPAREVAHEIGANARAVHLDVTSEDQWQEAVGETVERWGRLDVLVNNAGVVHFASIRRTTLEDYRRIVDINQVGVFLGMRAVVGPMAASGGGSIINISSTAGLGGSIGQIAYVASKWAVTGMTKAAALELAHRRIRVNSLHPGPIETDMFRSAPGAGEGVIDITPLGRVAAPEEVAEAALFFASDQSSFCTGAALTVDGGMTAGMFLRPFRPEAASGA